MKKQVYKSPLLKGAVERKRKQKMYVDAETVRLAVEKREGAREKRLAELREKVENDFRRAREQNKRNGPFGKRIYFASSIIEMAEAFPRKDG